MFMCDVEELTDWRWEELRDNEIIQWDETELCSKTEAEKVEEPQE
jgi:hypothetical protein